MDEIRKHIKIAFKILISFTIPLFTAIFILYELVFEIKGDWSWRKLIFFSLFISFVSVSKYKKEVVEISIDNKDRFKTYLKEKLKHKPWSIIKEDNEKLIVHPKFDRPYSWIYKERIIITTSDNYVQLKGSKVYIDKLKAIINNKESIWDKRMGRYLGKLAFIFIISFPILIYSGVIYRIKSSYHEYRIENLEKISFIESSTLGNTVNNINNYGGAVESEKYFFYLKDHLALCRTDKDFENEIYLIDKPSGTGVGRLNVIDDWIFYGSGKELNRMKIDGSNKDTIYNLGYILDMHVLDNWIYFINHSDHHNIYKIDVNGQNLHKISDTSVRDISIYENKIYYSYEKDGEGHLETMDLNGKEKQLIANILVDNLVKEDDVIYYTNYNDFKLYKYNLKDRGEPEILVEEKISRFLIVDNWIYYSKKPEDVGYPGTGLFKIDINGENKEKIRDDNTIEYLNRIGDWILFSSAKGNKVPSLKRMNIKDNVIIEMD